jgi:tetratricopeptide (TPR) repeat protein
VLAEFSQRQIDYFHALAPALRGPETIRNGALALESHARAMRTLGHLDVAGANAAEAVQLLEGLRSGGDTSEATLVALAQAYAAQSLVLDNKGEASALTVSQRAAELLRPAALAPGASIAVRRAYVAVLTRMGRQQWAGESSEDAARTETEAMRIAADLGARDFTDLHMGAYYAEAGGWRVQALFQLGRNDEARRVATDSVAVAEKVLERRPGYRLALHAQQLIESEFAQLAGVELNPLEAARASERALQVSATILRLDPDNITSINNLAVAELTTGEALWHAGRLREAVQSFQRATADFGRAVVGGTAMATSHSFLVGRTAVLQTILGDLGAADATIATGVPYLAKLRKIEPPGSLAVAVGEWSEKLPAALAASERDDLPAAQRLAGDALRLIQAAASRGGEQARWQAIAVAVTSSFGGTIEYRRGNFAAAEKAEHTALEARRIWGEHTIFDQRDLAEMSTWLAMAQARQGRISEAAQTIAPVVKLERELAARNHGDQWLPLELARALYAQSLTDPTKSAALLREAARLVDGLAPALQPLHQTRLWREWIRQAQGSG